MDEIEWKKYAKKVLFTFAIIFICTGISLFILMLTIGIESIGIVAIITDMNRIMNMLLTTSLGFIIGFLVFEGIVALVLYIIYKIKYSGRKVVTLEKEYLREIPKEYSPAVSSLIYDLKIDIYRDYTATILCLCTKKYINIKNNNGKYEFEILKTDNLNLSESEKYVFDKIANKTKFDEFKYMNKIIEEAKKHLLIIDKSQNKKKKDFFSILLIIVLFILIYYVDRSLLIAIIPIVYYLIIIKRTSKKSFNNGTIDNTEFKSISTLYERTHKGKKIAKKLQALRNYIREYTLIKEKDIDYIQVLEEYIPYAIALDEADTIEKFIKHNEEYRSLIYDKKIDE